MKNVSKETVIRTIVLFITLVNQVLIAVGKNPLPFAEDDIYIFLSGVASILATVWAWWKNNSFTPEAVTADELKDKLKEMKNLDGKDE